MKINNFYKMLFVPIAILLCSITMNAQGKFGAGFAFGEPTGIAWKYRISQSNALDGAIGFSPFDRYRIHVDYLWQSNPFHEQRLELHYGIGAVIGFGRTEYVAYRGRYAYFLRDQEIGFAARAPIGLSYMIPRSPVDLFVELAPTVIFTPGTGVGVDGELGGRLYF